MVDSEKEISKLAQRIEKLEVQRNKLQQATKVPDYANKVPQAVQDSNKEKVGVVVKQGAESGPWVVGSRRAVGHPVELAR